MVIRFLEQRLKTYLKHKSVLLLGPRQVGKSTLLHSLKPALTIDLSNESVYRQHLKDPQYIELQVGALEDHKAPIILVDEIQRIPSLLNTIQSLIDANKSLRFLISGSSARKLARGRANLLPGRILSERLFPLTWWEIQQSQTKFNLDHALQLGLLPEIYLSEIGAELIGSYADIYLREEIQAEALVKDVSAYARFLDIAAELSGQFINYAKLSSDAEVNKDTIRNFFSILEETLLIGRVASFGVADSARKARQKDKFYFFDVGVRNAVLKKQKSVFTDTEKGLLFEHFIYQNLVAYKSYQQPAWEINTYRDDRGLEVDFILKEESKLTLLEIKHQKKFRPEFESSLLEFESLVRAHSTLNKKYSEIEKVIIYVGQDELKTRDGTHVLPFGSYFDKLSNT